MKEESLKILYFIAKSKLADSNKKFILQSVSLS